MEGEKKETKGDEKDIEENKIITILSYFGILCLVPLLLKKESKFAMFHAKQGLVLTIAWFFVWFPLIGQLLWIVLTILSIWGVFNVLSGKYTKLPIIADLAEKINI
jgi:uncharacterized membrane protein